MPIANVNRYLIKAVALMSVLMFLPRPGIEAAVDWTIRSKATGVEVVESVVDIIQQSCIFPDDRLILRRIAAVETNDGEAEKTFSVPDFYGGIWQIDKPSFIQTKSSANATVYNKINSTFKVDWKTVHYTDLVKPLYSGLAARLKIASYFRTSDIPQDVQSQAEYWAQHFTTNTWGNLTSAIDLYTQASTRTATRCRSPKADVVFVLDSSGSITASHFNKVRQFVVNVVQSFVIGRKNVRVSLIQFSNDVRIEFNLTAYTTAAQIISVSSTIPYMDSGTNTAAGLQALESVVKAEGRLDEGVPVVAILMTDGQSNDRSVTFAEAARVHQSLANKVTVYSIGVGTGVDSTELEAIASSPSCQYVFHLASFNDITAFAYQIMKKACEEPAQMTENRVVTATVLKGEEFHFSATVRRTRRGVEFTVKGRDKSRAKGYLSWTKQKPNAAMHDYSFDVGSSTKQVMVPYPKYKSENSVIRRRRDVSNNTQEAGTDSPMVTLYGTLEGVGEEESGNSFDISYAVSDRLVDVTDEPEPSLSPTFSSSIASAVTSFLLSFSLVV